ncbi:hypothetical protein B0I35DRAFT_406880 [Stachybotrys elegans]|uniref:Beta/gamma crystallin 'Greek key' domain-containing protein n=1 Tax=Stachybotrys elegans TaxID=80388 RepID=A0A8K0SWH3_9HYPO|nr:hypothetical protein B0I35DRAFT_406880 [Stachybotrys elegans]
MLFSKALTIFPAFMAVALSVALPVIEENVGAADNETISINALTSMTVFQDSNFQGASRLFYAETNACIGLDGTGWSNRISSVLVENGYRCRLWDSSDIYAPGAAGVGGMNDRTTSFKCYQN